MILYSYHIVAYLDGLPPSLRFGDASRQAKVNALRELHKRMIAGQERGEVAHGRCADVDAVRAATTGRSVRARVVYAVRIRAGASRV